jgi:hypothetical protein
MASFSSSAASEEKRNCSLHNTKDSVSSEQGKYKESYSDHREKTKNNETNLIQAKYILTESASYEVSQNVNGIIKRSFYIIFEYPINHDKKEIFSICSMFTNGKYGRNPNFKRKRTHENLKSVKDRMDCTVRKNENKKISEGILSSRVLLTGSMPTRPPGAKTSLSHSLVVGTPRLPARMRIQLELSCFSA